MRVFNATIAAAVILLLPAALEGAESPAATDAGSTMFSNFDLVGQAPEYSRPKKARGPRIFVWYEDGSWRIRTTSVKNPRRFEGRIQVVGGKVVKAFNFRGLEPAKQKDLGMLDKSRTVLSFRFRTKAEEDGFDFVLSPKSEGLKFELTIDGYGHPEIIFLGPKGVHPPKARFSLPAQPIH